MTHNAFKLLLKRRLELIESTLESKAGEYAADADRLHNFTRSAAITGESKGQVCFGFFVKHLVSVMDMVAADAKFTRQNEAVIDEKIGDAINYLVLLEAILKNPTYS